MTEFNPSHRPRLYQDIDDALVIADGDMSPYKTVALRGHGNYAPKVVDRLDRLVRAGAELVWCTTWSEPEIAGLTAQIGGLRGGRVLEPIPIETDTGDPKSHPIYAKLEAVNRDQEETPGPFVWTDDELFPDVRARINSRHVNTPHLLVRPRRRVGYTEIKLTSVEEFVENYPIQPTDLRG